jgi:hypothetical protein
MKIKTDNRILFLFASFLKTIENIDKNGKSLYIKENNYLGGKNDKVRINRKGS